MERLCSQHWRVSPSHTKPTQRAARAQVQAQSEAEGAVRPCSCCSICSADPQLPEVLPGAQLRSARCVKSRPDEATSPHDPAARCADTHPVAP